MDTRFATTPFDPISSSAREPCLVFDLDDTLFLEREYVRSGFQAVGKWARRNLGVSDFAERAWELFEKGYRRRLFDVLLERRGSPSPSIIEQLVKVYRTHLPRISALPDAIDCLLGFHGKAILALITDGPAVSQRQKIRALKLTGVFDLIVLTGLWGNSFAKPHLRAFQLIQARLKPSDGRFIYVADNPEKDFIAPRTLGWQTVRVRRADGLHVRSEAVPGCEADIELTDLSGLRDFVYRRTPVNDSCPC
jgi:putative hydrolase of the HAD superfamily